MNKIVENTVFQCYSQDGQEEEKIRVIWVDEDYIIAYYISLNGECPVPKKCTVRQLEAEIEAGFLSMTIDPFDRVLEEHEIPEKYKDIRDYNWSIVQHLWNNSDKNLLKREYRSKCLKETAMLFHTNEKKVMRLISRFWQRGMKKNSLLPDYDNSGGKGKDKTLGSKKVGRPKNPSIFGEEPPEGINVTEDIKRVITTSLDLFYYTKQKKSLRETYNLMLEKFFSDKYMLQGKEIAKIWDESRIPNYDQFYYWYKKLSDYRKNYVSRLGENSFQRNQRELIGNSTMETDGPGSRYQIDATVADVYLLSSLSKEKLVIGRPVVYAVMDVYTRLITGLYCGLEGPSWIGAMMALDNVIEDKTEFCSRYDVEIKESDWPNSYLPEKILADRGEFEGYNVENFLNNLNVKIENTAPCRGDLKGIVERNFRTVNEKLKHTTPGAVQKEYRERLEKDYRLEAVLNLKQFTTIMIYSVLHHNKSIVEDYPRERGMITDMVLPIPNEMWKWGLKNRRCGFKRIDRDIVRLNLLPRGTAAITREGIRFEKLFYSCETAMEEQWFINPQNRNIGIVYDPRWMNNIYIPDSRGRSFTKCFMLEKSYAYKDLPMQEIIFQQELEHELIKSINQNQVQNDVDWESAIQGVIKQAKTGVGKTTKKSDRESVRAIKENRATEKKNNRQNEAFELDKKSDNGYAAEVINIKSQKVSAEEYKPQSKLDLLRKKRDELRGK